MGKVNENKVYIWMGISPKRQSGKYPIYRRVLMILMVRWRIYRGILS